VERSCGVIKGDARNESAGVMAREAIALKVHFIFPRRRRSTEGGGSKQGRFTDHAHFESKKSEAS